jgi:uncharacterized C2H2 Zn-finger protein
MSLGLFWRVGSETRNLKHCHLNMETFVCSQCRAVFPTRKQKEKHLEIHRNNINVLYQTGKFLRTYIIANESSVNVNIKKINNFFQCVRCSKLFKWGYSIKRHARKCNVDDTGKPAILIHEVNEIDQTPIAAKYHLSQNIVVCMLSNCYFPITQSSYVAHYHKKHCHIKLNEIEDQIVEEINKIDESRHEIANLYVSKPNRN